MICNIIASGSTGNAVVLNGFLMIDCGVSFKALNDVYKKLRLVLLTHIHGDHFNRATIERLACERPTLHFGCCAWLLPALISCGVSKENIFVMQIGKLYDFGACKASPVKLYHDVPNAGYRIYIGAEKALYCTDTRHLDGIFAKDYDLYLIEANYEEDEIEERIQTKQTEGKFCYETGVLTRHLSKEQADAFLLENMGDNSEYIYLHQHRERKGNG